MRTRMHDPFAPVIRDADVVANADVRLRPLALLGVVVPPEPDEFDGMNRAAVAAYAKDRGIPYYGTREQILARIRERG